MIRSSFLPLPRRSRPSRRLRGRAGNSPVGCESLERRDCPAALFSIEPPTGPIIEGDRATFTVRLAAPSKQPERLLVSTVAETATLGRDYTFQNDQQLLFAPGVTTRQFTINTLSDTLREGVETLRIVVTPANRPGAQPITTRASIYDLVPTSVSVGDVRVTEGNEGTTNADFVVRLTAGAILPVTLQYTTQNGTATAGTDYTATTGTLTFAPGEFVKTVSVPILGDRIAETDETFRLLLSNPSRGTTIRTPQATCTIVNDETDQLGFQITVDYTNPNLPAAQRSVFERAVTRLQQIIVGDVPGVTLPDGRFIDDMRIRATVETMDPGLNGYARPLQFRPGAGGLPYDGEIFINSARIGNPGIYHTVIHEMLHALGFLGNFFSATGTVTGLGTATPLFTGTSAVREYNGYFGLASSPGVPLYGVIAEAGSYGSHWDTATIGTEIMSVGWDTTSTALRPFSRITVGALDDIGYDVNYAAADAYTRPADVALAQFAFATVPAAAARFSASIEVAPVRAAVLTAPLRTATNPATGAAPIVVTATPPTTARPSTAATSRTTPKPAQSPPSISSVSASAAVPRAFATR